MSTAPLPQRRFTGTQWLILILASIGFAFDIYELLMAQFIMRPAIMELTGAKPGTPEFARYVALLFYVPAFVGGIFGLLGGYLTDRLGRRRILTWSILLYAVSAFLAGFSTSINMLLVLRTTTFIGVCVEFVAAVAWLAELFPEPVQREKVLGYTQAFSSLGGFLVAGANHFAIVYAASLPAVVIPEFANFLGTIDPEHQHEAWRYTLMSGLIPAIPLIFIRPFLPESPAWAAKKAAGTLRRASIRELFEPRYRRTTIVTALMFGCSYGAAFGAIQQMPQIVPGLPQVIELTKGKPVPVQKKIEQEQAAVVGEVQEAGGLFGRFLLAILAVRIVSRRKLLRVFQIPGLIVLPITFAYCAINDLYLLYGGIFLVGLFTVGQFSFWGNYLPRMYPVHLRGTGEGFAANIGGRMLGTSFAAVTAFLATQITGEMIAPHKLAFAAAGVGTFVYVCGLILCFWLPEPGPEEELEN